MRCKSHLRNSYHVNHDTCYLKIWAIDDSIFDSIISHGIYVSNGQSMSSTKLSANSTTVFLAWCSLAHTYAHFRWISQCGKLSALLSTEFGLLVSRWAKNGERNREIDSNMGSDSRKFNTRSDIVCLQSKIPPDHRLSTDMGEIIIGFPAHELRRPFLPFSDHVSLSLFSSITLARL